MADMGMLDYDNSFEETAEESAELDGIWDDEEDDNGADGADDGSETSGEENDDTTGDNNFTSESDNTSSSDSNSDGLDDSEEEEEEEEEGSDDEDDSEEGNSEDDDSEDEEDSEDEDDSEDDSDDDDEEGDFEDSGDVDDFDPLKMAIELGKKKIASYSQEDEVNTEELEKQKIQEYKDSLEISDSDFSVELDAIKLPDKVIKVGKNEVNLKDFEERYPEVTAVSKLLAVSLAKKIVMPQVSRLQQSISAERFFSDLSVYHPDARVLKDTDEFKDWRKNAPEEVQALLSSDDPIEVALALDVFKKDMSDSMRKEQSKKPVKKKKKVSGNKKKTSSSGKKSKKSSLKKNKKILKGNLSSKRKKPRMKGTFDPFDESDAALDAAWNEDL